MYFKLEPGKKGRLKYLAMTLLPAYALTKVAGRLASAGVLPASDLTGCVTMIISLALMSTLGYFLVLRKNHIIEVGELSVSEKDWQGKCRIIPIGKIRGMKRNILNEILLTDESGKVLLCVESNMENRDKLVSWLQERQINETT